MLLTQEVRDRYERFWNRENTDRACIFCASWNGTSQCRPAKSLEESYFDADFREMATLDYVRNRKWYLDGFPAISVNFGPQCLCSVLTGYYRYDHRTVWYESDPPFIQDVEHCPPLVLNKESPVYRIVEEMTDRMLAHNDECVVSLTCMGCTLDVISALIGSQSILYEMYDHPDEVKAIRDAFLPIWVEYYRHLSEKLMRGQGGVVSWLPVWSDIPYNTLQADMCAMLSPAMFREFVLPDLEYRSTLMGRSIYHLDGPDEIRHLDMILSLPYVNAVQWVSGAGNPPSYDPCWFDLLRRIQAAGKGLVMNEAGKPADVERLFRNLDQRGLYVITDVRDEQEANELADTAVRLNGEHRAD